MQPTHLRQLLRLKDSTTLSLAEHLLVSPSTLLPGLTLTPELLMEFLVQRVWVARLLHAVETSRTLLCRRDHHRVWP